MKTPIVFRLPAATLTPDQDQRKTSPVLARRDVSSDSRIEQSRTAPQAAASLLAWTSLMCPRVKDVAWILDPGGPPDDDKVAGGTR
jgi:hypothetical protein